MKCRICSNEKENQRYQVREMMFGYRDVFSYFQCSACGCLQILDIPSDMSKYYPPHYYSYQAPSDKMEKDFLLQLRKGHSFFKKGFVGRFLYTKLLRKYWPHFDFLKITEDASILDVGCGSGALLYALCELGMKNLLGIDPFNLKDIKYQNGLLIQKKPFCDVAGKWDIIIFNHSFEHIPDPIETLETAFKLLKPAGCCVIRTPTVSSYAWKHYGVNWVQLDAPRHLFLHSIKSMALLADRVGLNFSETVYDSTSFQFWGSEQYIRNIPLRDQLPQSSNPKKSIFSKKEISIFSKRAKELNKIKQGDQAVFYLTKS